MCPPVGGDKCGPHCVLIGNPVVIEHHSQKKKKIGGMQRGNPPPEMVQGKNFKKPRQMAEETERVSKRELEKTLRAPTSPRGGKKKG